jgi:hypothetical protein
MVVDATLCVASAARIKTIVLLLAPPLDHALRFIPIPPPVPLEPAGVCINPMVIGK